MTTRSMAPRFCRRLLRSLGLAVVGVMLLQSIVTDPAQPVLPDASQPIATANYPLLKPGDSGAQVKQLQLELAQLGLYPGAIDSIYGPGTSQAVRSLQQQQGLVIDGVAGAQTWQALKAQGSSALTLPVPALGAGLLTFTPLVVAQPSPPPSALWLALMPLVPMTGGALTYLYRRFQRRFQRFHRRRAQRRWPPKPRLPR
jgi:hypothetical protein